MPVLPVTNRIIIKLLIVLAVYSMAPAVPVHAEEVAADMRYHYVQPGQNLDSIVRQLYPQRQHEWEKLKQQIIHDNPAAFIDGDETQLQAGTRLTLPKRMVVKPRPVAQDTRPTVYGPAEEAAAVDEDKTVSPWWWALLALAIVLVI
jgi:Tfp pilus assembly protein FimV